MVWKGGAQLGKNDGTSGRVGKGLLGGVKSGGTVGKSEWGDVTTGSTVGENNGRSPGWVKVFGWCDKWWQSESS